MGIVCAIQTSVFFIRKVFHHKGRPLAGEEKCVDGDMKWKAKTYTKDGWIVGHLRRGLCRGLILDTEVLHITAAEHNVLVDLVGRCNLLLGLAFAAFRAVRDDIFEGDRRVLRADIVKNARVPNVTLRNKGDASSVGRGGRMLAAVSTTYSR